MKIGVDIGSTTIKAVVLDGDKIIYKTYERHFSLIKDCIGKILLDIDKNIVNGREVSFAVSGSAGMGLAEKFGFEFVQEVYANKLAIKKYNPHTDVAIELGGEDAKIIFLHDGNLEVFMNGTCAGGTGAFIDQMATLLNVSLEELDRNAAFAGKYYTIASRCGVFAKSDLQPLMNQGVNKNEIAKSIFYAVANQTIGGLAQGRKIAGNILYLGGPLTFNKSLRAAFDDSLKVAGVCPQNSLYYAAIGAVCAPSAVSAPDAADAAETISAILEKLESRKEEKAFTYNPPLFASREEYDEFVKRHEQNKIKRRDVKNFFGNGHFGVDVGSTTIKFVLIDEKENLLYSGYRNNTGNPVPVIKEILEDIYKNYKNVTVVSGTVTGYGEEMIKNAFNLDFGIVETIAHFTAAGHFMPDVDFVIDIGGQDMKCFSIEKGIIKNIFLNEACSSGCGSFLQTFANTLGYSAEEFSKLALFADKPVDLGSRCTVFMNSSVKQAQKEGASVENISAGLCISVVKNALYKVIRVVDKSRLGKKIVVQGGTFYNQAVLRAFERELNTEVICPDISGLMGAYGCALHGLKNIKDNKTKLLSPTKLEEFSYNTVAANCKLCGNNCKLSVVTFSGGGKYISGNKCNRPNLKTKTSDDLNMYEFKRRLLKDYMDLKSKKNYRGTMGIPLGLNMYELIPFWQTFFSKLKFELVFSPMSNREIYLKGQSTIPSDTVCFPAKLMHGHMQYLVDKNCDYIFYPCMTYNFDEKKGDNNYNCPVVAYYPEVIKANMSGFNRNQFISDYIGIHRPGSFPKKMYEILSKYVYGITKREVARAAKHAYNEYYYYMSLIKHRGGQIIKKARQKGMEIVVLAGRPYHIDIEINHGIDKLLSSLGVAVISEDGIGYSKKINTKILNQWTYHARMYNAAEYIADKEDMHLIQLVSFGCGLDAITTDEVSEILGKENKIYTQIKIDEITNLGAVKIRLRSLMSAIEQKKSKGSISDLIGD